MYKQFISHGARGSRVTHWQNFLVSNGFSVGLAGADGIFGGDTDRATIAFQNQQAIPATAVLDSTTITAAAALGFTLLKGAAGADSSDMVTAIYQHTPLLDLAKGLYGGDPVFWGRYFKNRGNADTVQYQAARENAALNSRNIPVLPVARQTNHVGGTAAQGTADAVMQVDALVASFSAAHLAAGGGDYYFFLDVEPETPLSRAYYTAWAAAVIAEGNRLSGGAFSIVPCAYINGSDTVTCQALNDSISLDGAVCKGVWVARYLPHPPMSCIPLPEWDDNFLHMPVKPLPPVLAWQYTGDCFGNNAEGGPFDGNEVNPFIDLQNDLLAHLILPPA